MYNQIQLSQPEEWILCELSKQSILSDTWLLNNIPKEFLDKTDARFCNLEMLLESMSMNGWIEYHPSIKHSVSITESGYSTLRRHQEQSLHDSEQLEILRKRIEVAEQSLQINRESLAEARKQAAASERAASLAEALAKTAREESERSIREAAVARKDAITAKRVSFFMLIAAIVSAVSAAYAAFCK